MTSRQGEVGSALGPVLKPTGFLTNSKCIAKELSQICTRYHEHVPLVGGRSAAAAIYPHKLCAAICKGLAAQIRADEGLRIDTPLMNSNGLRKLSQACQEATSPELNALCFDPIESGETHESDTDMKIGRTLDAVFANRYSSCFTIAEIIRANSVEVVEGVAIDGLFGDESRPRHHSDGGRGGG